MIKKTWLAKASERNELYTLAIRQNPGDIKMGARSDLMPPTELVDGKKMNITDAINYDLAEWHHSFGVFTIEDLIKLRTAIDEVLYER